MSLKIKNASALFGLISVLLILIGCPAKPDYRSANANISEIKVDDTKVTIEDALSPNGWKTTVNNSIKKITLTVKLEDSKATPQITCNDKQVDSQKEDKTKFECSLNEGKNTIKIVATAEKGNSKTATIIVYRESEAEFNKNTLLKTLKAGEDDILQSGTENTITLKPVKNKTVNIAITAVPTNDKAKVELKCNDSLIAADVSDKTKFSCPLNEGNNIITLQVTAADGITKGNLISIKVKRFTKEEEAVALDTLSIYDEYDEKDKSLIPIPEGNKIALDYVLNKTTSILLTAKPIYASASVELKVNGAVIKAKEDDKTKFVCPLKEGDNTITLQVIAADGMTKGDLITLTVYRNTTEQAKDISFSDEEPYYGKPYADYFKNMNIKGKCENWQYDSDKKLWTCNMLPADLDNIRLMIKLKNIDADIDVNVLPPARGISFPKFKDGSCRTVINAPVDYENKFEVKLTSENGEVTDTFYIEIVKDSKIGIDKDTSYEVKNGDKNLNLSKNSDGSYSCLLEDGTKEIDLKVKARSPKATCGINEDPSIREASKKITISSKKTSVTIKVKSGEGTIETTTLHLVLPDKVTTLKSLTIDKATDFNFESVQTTYNNIPVPFGPVVITAEASDENSEVIIDDKSKNDPGYGTVNISNSKLKVEVKVKNGFTEKVYSLNFIEAKNSVALDVLVVNSVGGTIVDGTKLKVFDAGNNTQVGAEYNVENGKVRVTGLASNKHYNFELIGEQGKWAGSLIENYFINAEENQKLTMIQFKHGDHTRGVTPPKVSSVTNNTGAAITEGATVNKELSHINVEFTSTVGAVEEKAWSGFGSKLGIGSVPNQSSGIYGKYEGTDSQNSNFTSRYKFELGENIVLPSGNTSLVIVGYDVANNRVEKHIHVKVDTANEGNTLEMAKFVDMYMLIQRFPNSDGLYSAEENDIMRINTANSMHPYALNPDPSGNGTSYKAIFLFKLKEGQKNIPIIGFDIYRRLKGSTDEFERVSRTLYGKPKEETSSSFEDTHIGYDTDSRLEENIEYEYKILAYNGNFSKESPVVTGKVMESFTYSLDKPQDRKRISFADAQNLDYSFKISNTNLLKNNAADILSGGFLIVDQNGYVQFGSKFSYVFDLKDADGNYTGKSDLVLATKKGRLSITELLKENADALKEYGIETLEDIVKLDTDTGIFTCKSKFLKVPFFNIVTNKAMEYKKGTSYQWDVQNWGDNAYSLQDDLPIRIVKAYEYENEFGEKDIIQCQSFGNNFNGSNAVNGRFTFIIEN